MYWTHRVNTDAEIQGDDVPKKELVGPYTIYRKRVSFFAKSSIKYLQLPNNMHSKMTWADARTYCEKKEGHLATFEAFQDAALVSDKIYEMSEKVTEDFLHGKTKAEFGLNRRYWIGLTDIGTGEGKWSWAGKGTPLNYTNMWFPGQPDHVDENGKYQGRPEHCGSFWNPVFHKGNKKHSFDDMECELKYYFVCEKDEQKMNIQKEYNSKGQPSQTGRAIVAGRGVATAASKKALKKRLRKRPIKLQNNKDHFSNEVDTDDSAERREVLRNLKTNEGFKELFEDSLEDTDLNPV